MRHLERILRAPTTARELRVFQLASAQIRELAPESHRITLMSSRKDETYNLGKDAGPIIDGVPTERFFLPSELLLLISHLIAENDRNLNIFLTPFHELLHYIVIDDLVPETIDQVRHAGLDPHVLMESSPSRYQGILLVPKSLASKSEANALFRTLNQRYGDPKISGLVHGFRLAGFSNRKDEYRDANGHYPFVRMVSTHQNDVPGLTTMLDEIRAAAIVNQKEPREKREPAIEHQRPLDTDAVAYACDHYKNLETHYGPEYDRTKADYMLGRRLLAQGHDAQAIRDVLEEVSPGLLERQGSEKKLRTYCRKTVAAVLRAEKQLQVINQESRK